MPSYDQENIHHKMNFLAILDDVFQNPIIRSIVEHFEKIGKPDKQYCFFGYHVGFPIILSPLRNILGKLVNKG